VKNPYTRQNFGATIGGPVKIHGVYDGTRRTNFVVTYNGSRGSNLFDQYATVPTAAMRAGDFSLVNAPLIDPATGQPFPNNQIPVDRISPTSLALLDYYPLPNLGGLTQNFHRVDTVSSVNDTLNVRVTHNFTPAAAGGGRGGGGRGGFGGGGGRGGRRPGRARPGAGDGRQHDRAVAVPPQRQRSAQRAARARRPHVGRQPRRPRVVQHPAPRTMHTVNVNYSSTSSQSLNNFANTLNVAGNAGIAGVSADPFDYGLPALSFSTFQGVRDVTPSRRNDKRVALAYS
jgi:hypothetical protein